MKQTKWKKLDKWLLQKQNTNKRKTGSENDLKQEDSETIILQNNYTKEH